MIVRASILTSALSLLLAGAASAADPKPTPEELWRSFPLNPAVTTPPPPSTSPAQPQPADPGPPPEPLESSADDRWMPLVLGGLAGSLLLVVSGGALLAMRRRREALAPAPMSREPRELIAQALALAREAADCDMLLDRQRLEGAIAMSERIPDQVVPTNDETSGAADEATPGRTALSTYAEIGERVAGVLSAAEVAAERIRADARSEAEELVDQARREAEDVRAKTTAYDSDTRAAVESYATERRRDADQQERKQLADAEVQARATREAAEEMARDIEEAARQRGQALREESRSVEERLQRAVQGLRGMTVQLEELLGAPTSPTAGASLADALKPAVREGDARQPLVALPRDDSR